MFRKPIFLYIAYIATFVLAVGLAFFISHLFVQEVRGVSLGNNIDVNGNQVINVGAALSDNDGASRNYFESVLPCFSDAGITRCIDSWCDLNDFSFCGVQDNFPPYGDEPPACFTAQTPILMADGKYKNIADVQPGEYVLTRESEDSSKLVKAKVLEVYEYWVNRYLIINDFLEVTREHPMFVNGKWKIAGKIKLGDTLLNKDNQEVVVESIEEVAAKEKLKVYNLEIEQYKTYFANGFYVHNVKPYEY